MNRALLCVYVCIDAQVRVFAGQRILGLDRALVSVCVFAGRRMLGLDRALVCVCVRLCVQMHESVCLQAGGC